MNNQLMAQREVLDRYGIDRTTLWLWRKKRNFPGSVTPPNCPQCFRASDIYQWELENAEINSAS